MRVLLFVLSGMAFVAGFGILGLAKSAIHETEAFLLFLISAVLLSGAAIVEAVVVAQKKFESILRERPASMVPVGNVVTADSGQDFMTTPHFPSPHQFPEAVPQDLPPQSEFMVEHSDKMDEKSASDIFDQARRLAQSGSREKAIELLRELVHRFPKTVEAEKARKTLEKSGISSRN